MISTLSTLCLNIRQLGATNNNSIFKRFNNGLNMKPKRAGTSRFVSVRAVILLLNSLLMIIHISKVDSLIPSGQESLCKAKFCDCLSWSTVNCFCTLPNQVIQLRKEGEDHLPNDISIIKINNCFKVIITKKSLEHLNSLKKIELKNIKEIIVEENAFSWNTSEILHKYDYPGIDIHIENTTIPVLPSYTFKGYLNSIFFRNVKIKQIKPFAFSNLAVLEKLMLKKCDIDAIDPQSFKKFIVKFFVIDDGYIEKMPSYSIMDVTVENEMKIKDVEFGIVKSLAIKAQGMSEFVFESNYVRELESESFKLETKGPVFIQDNIFANFGEGSFAGISANKVVLLNSGKQKLIFDNNTFLTFQEGALRYNGTSFKMSLERVMISKPCYCQEIDDWLRKLEKYVNDISTDIRRLSFCESNKLTNKENKYISLKEYYDKYCEVYDFKTFWIITIVIIVIILVVIAFVMSFCIYRKYKKMYKHVRATNNAANNPNRISTYSTGSNHIMILPDSKTYKETELNIFQEQAEPLKNSVNDLSTLRFESNRKNSTEC